jgi:dipeptidase D
MALETLQPQGIWKYFEKICSIPHPSKHEKGLAEYIFLTGKKRNLETQIDDFGNVLIRKPATSGYEHKPTVILQAHIDMVPQKNSLIKHDFVHDPIVPRIDGEWVKATNTTLGADNGIGAASILALLESTEVQHGPIEALFTLDEETGMGGAFALKPGFLKGSILINTDSEDDRELIVGCAGGTDFTATFAKKTIPLTGNNVAYTVFFKGLKGGHSGVDIALGRGNANVLLARLLAKVIKKYTAYVADFEGGNMRNVIPREAQATVCIDKDEAIDFLVFVKKFFKSYEVELKGIDDNLKIACKEVSTPEIVLEPDFCYELLKAITCCPNGVIGMEQNMKGVVATSTNLSIVHSGDTEIQVHCLLRSSSEIEKTRLVEAMTKLFELFGASVTTYGNYPGWKPSTQSEILTLFKKVYPTIMGHEPEIKVIHAGLECGIIGSSHPNLDMISFGPTICFPHSPDEKVNIHSVGRYCELLKLVLKEL